MYYLARNQGSATAVPGAGTLSKIIYVGGNAPNITSNPSNTTVMLGAGATFSISADGATKFQWQRNGVDLPNAQAGSYSIAATTMADNGARFRVIVSSAGGNVVSTEAILTVTNNRPPVATITFPAADMQFAPGQIINFDGSGTDAEDGVLPASALSWKVDFQHDTHAHAFVAPTAGMKSGSFTVPAFEENEANMWIRISLTVTDASGASTTLSRNIFPGRQISQFSLLGTPVNGWGPYEVDRSNGEDGATDGRTIALSGVPYLHGLGVHAPSELRFALNSQCTGNFIADIGVDNESGKLGSVVFQVYLDNVKVYDSGTVRGGDPRKTVNVNVAGKKELRLAVNDAGDGITSDHADWGGARVSGCSTPSTPPQETIAAISNLQVFDTATTAYWSIQSNLKVGNTVYGDRVYTFASLPALLTDGKWIRTANDARSFTGPTLVNFWLSVAADVYVALDNRVGLPGWVNSSWADTGADLTTKEGAYTQRFRIFKKRFNAGMVSLGSAKQPGPDRYVSMYMIIVK